MPTIARSYVTAGFALFGASVISAVPITTLQPESRTASWDVSLVAATQTCAEGDPSALCGGPLGLPTATPFTPAADSTNMFNIPANLFIALANTPYNLFTALGEGNVQLGSEPDGGPNFQPTYEGITLTQPAGNVVGLGADLHYGGSWWVYSPTNILGTDTADVPRYQALTNVLIPFPALSVPLGNMLATIAASQLPMSSGCTGTGPGACDDPNAILSKTFDLRHIGALFSPDGYTFPTVKEGISCSEDGQCYVKDEDGAELPWSEQNVKLDPTTPFTSVYDSLTATPDFSSIKPLTPELVVTSLSSLGRGLNTAFNPFVLGTQCPICAPFVPNPDNEPVPGPIFEDPDTTDTAPEAATVEEVQVTESEDATEALSAPAATAEPEDATESLSAPAVTAEPETEEAPAPVTAGPKHRRPSAVGETVKQVQDSIKTSISKLTSGFKKPSSKTGDSDESTSRSTSTTKSDDSDSDTKKSDSGSDSDSDSDSGSDAA